MRVIAAISVVVAGTAIVMPIAIVYAAASAVRWAAGVALTRLADAVTDFASRVEG